MRMVLKIKKVIGKNTNYFNDYRTPPFCNHQVINIGLFNYELTLFVNRLAINSCLSIDGLLYNYQFQHRGDLYC